MQKLNANWLTEGLIDFEYKKYQLLSYFKNIRKEFRQTNLYPSLGELIFHFGNLQEVKTSRESIREKFPRKAQELDVENLSISYELAVKESEVLQELQEIISFALPRFQEAIEEGKEIYDFVEEHLEFEPVGVVPVYDDEGYLFLNEDRKRDLSVYRYQMSVFESSTERYRGINVTFLTKDFTDLSRSLEQVKVDLSRAHNSLPNPATYAVTYKMAFPQDATVLPIAKRLLMRHLGKRSI